MNTLCYNFPFMHLYFLPKPIQSKHCYFQRNIFFIFFMANIYKMVKSKQYSINHYNPMRAGVRLGVAPGVRIS